MSGAIQRMWVTLSIIPVRAIYACPSSSASPNLTLSFSCLQPTFPLASTFIHFYLSSALFIGLSKSDSCLEEKDGEKNPSLVSLQPSLMGRAEYTSSLFIQTCLSHWDIFLVCFASSPHLMHWKICRESHGKKKDVAPNNWEKTKQMVTLTIT